MSVLRLFENETDPGAAPDGGGGGGAPVADPPAPEAADDWSAPSRDDWESTQSTLAELQERMAFQQQTLAAAAGVQQPQYGHPQEPQAPPAPDPFSDSYERDLAQYVAYHSQQAVAPYQDAAQTWQQREGEARAQDIIHADVTQNGDFLVPDAATERIKELADTYYSTLVQQVPPGQAPQAATRAYEQAIQNTREWEKQVSDAAVERYRNQLAGLDPRRQQQLPASGDTTTQTFPAPGGGDEMALVRRYTGGQGLPT